MALFEPKEWQIAGFDLIGYRQKDGTIKLGSETNGEALDDFPKEIKTLYGVFTLEQVKRNDEGNQLGMSHSGNNLEWGIYV